MYKNSKFEVIRYSILVVHSHDNTASATLCLNMVKIINQWSPQE